MTRGGESGAATDPGGGPMRSGSDPTSRRSPVPVEAVGDAMREPHARHRLARDVGRVEEEEGARVPLVVVDENENVAVVLAGVRVAGEGDRRPRAPRRPPPAPPGCPRPPSRS